MKEELKDSSNVAGSASSDGPPPIIPETTSTQPRPEDMNGSKGAASSGGRPSSGDGSGGPVSSKKIEANRKNSQQSTGPRTVAGKVKAAANSYQHGFFAKHLFPTAEQAAKDKSDYLAVANGVYNHYQPVGYMEHLWVEKIATEAVRLARLVGYEQKVMMAWSDPFWGSAADRILRYQTTANRRMLEAIKELERLQSKRMADVVLSGGTEPGADDNRDEPDGPTESPEGPADEPSPATSGFVIKVAGAQSQEPGASGFGATASTKISETNPPPTGQSGQITNRAANAFDGQTQLDEADSDSTQYSESDGTNPSRTLADLVVGIPEEDR